MQKIRGIEFNREDYFEIKEEIKPLLEEHWEEIALNKDKIKLNPDWDLYRKIYEDGSLGIYTAREDGQLVGYFVVIVTPNIHYKDHLFATNDIIFLRKDHRKGRTGINLIKFAEDDLKKFNVSVMVINVKTHKPFDRVLEWLGFKKIEHNFSKYIGD
tara:strand:- start:67 stop:537 length:471 start_codon:yes stop_codon:yes gene_type:complete